jgi:hypothetical protein
LLTRFVTANRLLKVGGWGVKEARWVEKAAGATKGGRVGKIVTGAGETAGKVAEETAKVLGKVERAHGAATRASDTARGLPARVLRRVPGGGRVLDAAERTATGAIRKGGAALESKARQAIRKAGAAAARRTSGRARALVTRGVDAAERAATGVIRSRARALERKARATTGKAASARGQRR